MSTVRFDRRLADLERSYCPVRLPTIVLSRYAAPDEAVTDEAIERWIAEGAAVLSCEGGA